MSTNHLGHHLGGVREQVYRAALKTVAFRVRIPVPSPFRRMQQVGLQPVSKTGAATA